MRLGFTGTRLGMTPDQRTKIIGFYNMHLAISEAHIGDCAGADEQFHRFVSSRVQRPKLVGHPPILTEYRAFCTYDEEWMPKNYLDRDRDIVDCSDLLIAAPKSHKPDTRSGTWYTINYALKVGVPVLVVTP
jgi:hypothetical protein